MYALSGIMRWEALRTCLEQTTQHYSWLAEVLRDGSPRIGDVVVNVALKYGLSPRRSVSTCRTAAASPGNALSGDARNAGDDKKGNRLNDNSHAVIAAQFEELLCRKWGPKTPQRLDGLQVELSPMVVCRVLKKVPNPLARKFFNWAKSKSGYQHNMYTYTALIDHYGRTKNVAAIDGVLAEMCEVGCGMSVVTFSSLLHWYREANDLAGVRRVWEHMQRIGCRPNEYAYTTYIDALAKGDCHQEALEVFGEMQGHRECQPNMFTYNVVIHSLVKAGKLDNACAMYDKLFELHQRPNFVTFTILVSAHEKGGDLQKAVHFFKKMMEAGFIPSISLRSRLFKALALKARADEVADLTQQCAAMTPRSGKPTPKADGVSEKPPAAVKLAQLLIPWGPEAEIALKKALPSTLPSQYLATVFSHLSGHPEVAWQFFKWLRSQAAFEPSKYVYAIVMNILGKAGHVNLQLEVLANAEVANAANVVIYNTLLHSYCTRKQTDAALEVLEHMKEHGLKPNAHTYTMLIDLLSRTRNHAQAMKMYGEMVKAGCKPNMHTYTVIIHSLARSGKVNAAATLFGRLPSLGITPSTVTYTVLIQAFLRVKNVDRALESYEAMRSNGIIASRVTLRVLTGGLRTAGLHYEAERISREAPSSQDRVMKGDKLPKVVKAQEGVEAILFQS